MASLLLVSVGTIASANATGANEASGGQAGGKAPPGMVWVPGGEFTMGTDSDLGWPEEKPAHRVRVDGTGLPGPKR